MYNSSSMPEKHLVMVGKTIIISTMQYHSTRSVLFIGLVSHNIQYSSVCAKRGVLQSNRVRLAMKSWNHVRVYEVILQRLSLLEVCHVHSMVMILVCLKIHLVMISMSFWLVVRKWTWSGGGCSSSGALSTVVCPRRRRPVDFRSSVWSRKHFVSGSLMKIRCVPAAIYSSNIQVGSESLNVEVPFTFQFLWPPLDVFMGKCDKAWFINRSHNQWLLDVI